MITRLIAHNYRAFEELNIPLTKINLFLGPNNAGKSSIISAINLLSQTIDSDDRVIPLSLTGKFEDLGAYQDVVYRNQADRDITLGLEFLSNKIPKELGIKQFGAMVTYHYRPKRHEIVVKSMEIYIPPKELIMKTRIAQKGSNQLIEKVGDHFKGIELGTKSSGKIKLNHYFPRYINRARKNTKDDTIEGNLDFILFYLQRHFLQHLQSVEFIGPFRSAPERVYTFSGETPSSVGVHGEKAIDAIVADHFRRESKKINIADTISHWLKKAEIAESLEVVSLTDRHFEIRLYHYDTKEDENLADVGYGCSQILPILVSGYSIKSNSILMMEQPELHLHPKAQAEIGTFLLDVANRDVQIFVETHSEHLLLRLQSHVAAGDLSKDDISVFYVYSDREKRNKVCKLMPIGKDGFYTEKWPRGFFPERLEEAKRIAKYST